MHLVAEFSGDEIAEALRAAVSAAEHLGVAVSCAIVDGGGVLKAFYRMDGAEVAGATLAIDKAYTAVAHRAETQELKRDAEPGGSLFGLFAQAGGRYVTFAGGLPVWWNRRVIAGIGVSGGSPAEDSACARAAQEILKGYLPLGT
ncbi:MAG: heme-binding protein [Firmicutes bacterium]|nr:heme-binding protein [Bacillota bacterium]